VQTTYLHDPRATRLKETEQQEEADEHKQEASTGQGEEGTQAGEVWVGES